MTEAPVPLSLALRNVHFDGPVREWYEVLLRIVGDFSLIVQGETILASQEWCLVEFAGALSSWLRRPDRRVVDFVYTSMEAEEGLVRFSRIANGRWVVSSAW